MRSVLLVAARVGQRLHYIGAAGWRDVGWTHVRVGNSPRSDVSDRGPSVKDFSVPDRQKNKRIGVSSARLIHETRRARGVASRAAEEERVGTTSLLKLQ